MYTRKQLWRRCTRKISDLNIDLSLIKSIPKKIEKKVTFDNTVYLTLIPTRDELDHIKNMYYVSLNNKKNKIL